MRALLCVLLVSALGLSACAQFPALDATISEEAKAADYPRLAPIGELTASAPQPRITEDTAAGLSSRVAALRARAARLRGSVIDRATKQRMRSGVTAPEGTL